MTDVLCLVACIRLAEINYRLQSEEGVGIRSLLRTLLTIYHLHDVLLNDKIIHEASVVLKKYGRSKIENICARTCICRRVHVRVCGPLVFVYGSVGGGVRVHVRVCVRA